MTENDSGDQPSTKVQEQAFHEAVRLVYAEIEAAKKHLEDIAKTTDAIPIMVEGETFTDYDAHVMVNPSKVARIMLRHEYHFWDTLDEEAPDGMWQDIADMVGLKNVSCVGVSPKPKRQDEMSFLNTKTE